MQNDIFESRDLFGETIGEHPTLLHKRFIFPPFSVLSARGGDWVRRKRLWLSIGLESEQGREHVKLISSSKDSYFQQQMDKGGLKTISVFDPVLCELMYAWFCPSSGQIIDPFAGGSVRGVVAHYMGYRYWGSDISEKQVRANYEQAKVIIPENMPEWILGDSMVTLESAPQADFLFSCPPYGNLEVYSDLPDDISNMDHHAFIAAYNRIIMRACARLKEDRFACFVVGDFRCKKGFYRNFVSDTIEAFLQQGLKLYNEIILVTQAGSLPMRVTKSFDATRKIGKSHQNVLVFCKGDPKAATEHIKEMAIKPT